MLLLHTTPKNEILILSVSKLSSKKAKTDAEYVTINPTSRFSNSFSHTSVRQVIIHICTRENYTGSHSCAAIGANREFDFNQTRSSTLRFFPLYTLKHKDCQQLHSFLKAQESSQIFAQVAFKSDINETETLLGEGFPVVMV